MYNINSKYQLILIGEENSFNDEIIKTFKQRINDLGLVEDSINILNSNNVLTEYKSNSPAVALYFGVWTNSFPDLEIVEKLILNSHLIIPIVEDVTTVDTHIPESIKKNNAFSLKENPDIEPLVSLILENFNLLRLERRLFISYRRIESRITAIQLFEKFEECGFDVFLDTHSIRKGDPVMDEIWHRMVDTDVLVLLDTHDFLGSLWTRKELAKASDMSIGILQLIWPNSISSIKKNTPISIPVQLKKLDFAGEFLTDDKIKEIVSLTESLRARNLAARQNNIINEFIKTANSININPILQSGNFLTIEKNNAVEYVLIPTIGIPHAYTYNQKRNLIDFLVTHKNIEEAYLLFDNTHIKKQWLQHLDWLNKHLPIKSLPYKESEKWLKEKAS